MSRVDLHVHTRYSDGSWTPDELCREAKVRGLAALAVADHDTLAAVPEMIAAAREHGIEYLPAVEITCRVASREVHLLGYLPGDTWQDPALLSVLEHSKHIRRKRVDEMVARLNEHGILLTAEEVFALSYHGTTGRPHVALALVKRGVVRTTDEAFERFLRRGKPGFVERYRMEAAEAIDLVRRAGGVAVLAHPGLNKVDESIHDLAQQGLAGLEVWHSRHTPTQADRYRQLAERFSLIVTGGSDCHGFLRSAPLLGTVPVPYACLSAIYARAQNP